MVLKCVSRAHMTRSNSNASQAAPSSKRRLLSLTLTAEHHSIVFAVSQHPEKGLNVDHVPGLELPLVAAHGSGEIEQARVGVPGGMRVVMEFKAVQPSRGACDVRLEKNVPVGLRDEAKHCDDG